MPRPLQKIIFLTSENPFPATGGGKIREVHLLRLLRELAPVEVLCFRRGDGTAEPAPEGIRVIEIDREKTPLWKKSVYPLRAYVVNGKSEAMAGALREHAGEGTLLWISRLAMAQYIEDARQTGCKIVLDEQNVESDLLYDAALSSVRNLYGLWYAAQTSYFEGRFCKAADAVVATSDLDACKIGKLAPGARVYVVPNAIDAGHFEPIRKSAGETLFFSGTLSYGPNIVGLQWFTSAVLPLLRAHLGEHMPRIVVAGANPSPDLVRLLIQNGIEVHANPPSMLPFLEEAAVVFVPLRSGSGTRLKILEAMAAGRAVVSTGKGAEGLVLSPTYDIWIADKPDRFASAVTSLLEDQAKRRALGEHAATTVTDRYDWRVLRPQVESVVRSLELR